MSSPQTNSAPAADSNALASAPLSQQQKKKLKRERQKAKKLQNRLAEAASVEKKQQLLHDEVLTTKAATDSSTSRPACEDEHEDHTLSTSVASPTDSEASAASSPSFASQPSTAAAATAPLDLVDGHGQEEEEKETKSAEEEIQNVTPWVATSKHGFDYAKLIERFGCSAIDGRLIERFERVTKTRAHVWLRRGVFFSHKRLESILDDVEQGKQVYLYTGRGPTSESMHLGHTIPFVMTAYLQRALGAIVIIQMSDDEKFFFKGGSLEHYHRLTFKNAVDIIACGFDLDKTFIFSNMDTVGGAFYRIIVRVMQATTGNAIRGTYGLNLDNNVGQLAWPCFQIAPAFSQAFPHVLGHSPVRVLVPMAIDQAPYFRGAQDFANRFPDEFLKPAEIHCKFLVGLGGINDKMNSTGTGAAPVFLTDSKEVVYEKIRKFAFSGGGKTLAEHKQNGGNLELDVAYQWLFHFLEDDAKLASIAAEYRSGRMSSGTIKGLAADAVWGFLEEHQRKRALVTDEVLHKFFDASIPRHYEVINDNRPAPIDTSGDYSGYGVDFDPYFGQM